MHDTFILAMEHYGASSNLVQEALDWLELGQSNTAGDIFLEALEHFELGNANIACATQLLKEKSQ